jgi:hypothetical protein
MMGGWTGCMLEHAYHGRDTVRFINDGRTDGMHAQACISRERHSISDFLTCGMWDAINVGLLFFSVGSQNLWDP